MKRRSKKKGALKLRKLKKKGVLKLKKLIKNAVMKRRLKIIQLLLESVQVFHVLSSILNLFIQEH